MTVENEKDVLRDKIVEVSYNLFKKKSYENVTVNEICDACGITKPTFYSHIGSKDQLLAYFYTGLTSRLMEELLEQSTNDDYWQRIVLAFDSILSHSLEFGNDLYSQLFIANLKNNIGTFELQDSLTKVMVSLFEKAQKAGQIRNHSDPADLYLACANMSFGYGIRWCLSKGSSDLLTDFHTALCVVCDVQEEAK